MLNAQSILTLLSTPRVGRNTVQLVLATIQQFPSQLRELRDILIEVKSAHPRVTVPSLHDLELGAKEAEIILHSSERLGIRILSPGDQHFPQQLLAIPEPPVVLYTKGDQRILTSLIHVAVIGTREPTPYGVTMAERLGAIFGEHGLGVVSGLALGCDAAAHHGCLRAKGKAIAVLAHGLDRIYPAENRALGEQILAAGGCFVSEYPPGEKPRRNFFVERDRLQSGLSLGIVVVETDITGGTMHTVGFALKQHKFLACLVHSTKFRSAKSQGNEKLLQEGNALPLGSREAIQAFLMKLCHAPTGNTTQPSSSVQQKSDGELQGQLALLDFVEV